jgi:hypothetical protein
MNNSTVPIVGYSINDFFYENPKYCVKDTPNTPPHMLNGESEKDCTPPVSDKSNCPCTTNEYYGRILKQKKDMSDGELRKYNDSTNAYDSQVIRTINYSIGVGMICAYFIRIIGE